MPFNLILFHFFYTKMTLVSKDVHGVAILRSLEVVEVIRGHARSLGSKINVLSYQDSITKSLENLLKKF